MPQVVQTVKTPAIPAEKPKATGGRNLKVLHTQLDSWPKDFILSRNDLPVGADVDRLIRIGAVEEVPDERTGDAPLGPDSIAQAKAAQPVVVPVAEVPKP